MAAEIERIVDRKTIRGRVHYRVVWRGFGDESNTWESRMDLVADGYSNVIREYEEGRKNDGDDAAPTNGRSPSRGRSPGRGKSPARSKSPGRARGRPRGRSNSVTRSPSVSSRSRRRSSTSKPDTDTEDNVANGETPSRRRSSRKAAPTAQRLDFDSVDKHEEGEDLLRSAMAVLDNAKKAPTIAAPAAGETPKVRRASPRRSSRNQKPVELSYEDKQSTPKSPTKATKRDEDAEDLMQTSTTALMDESAADGPGLWAMLTESGWLLWFVSIVVVGGSLLASHVAPDTSSADAQSWRTWLPFLTPVVALLLVFHQRDPRASLKWVAIALSWRCAAELMLVVGAPGDYLRFALGSFAVSHAALLITIVSILRNGEHERSSSTLLVFVIGMLVLLLSDSWIVQEGMDPATNTRGELMAVATLTIAMSSVLTSLVEDE